MRLKEKVSAYFSRILICILLAACVDVIAKLCFQTELNVYTLSELFYLPKTWFWMFSIFVILMLWSQEYERREQDIADLIKIKSDSYESRYYCVHHIKKIAGQEFAYIRDCAKGRELVTEAVAERLIRETEESLDRFGRRTYQLFYKIFNYKAL